MAWGAGVQIAFGDPSRLWHIPLPMSCLRSHFLSLRRFAAFVALVAMLVPLVTGLVHTPSAQPLFRICGIDQPTNGDHGQSPTPKAPFCPICQSLHLLGDGFVPPNAVMVLAAPVFTATDRASDEAFLLTPQSSPQARPRAPPSLV